MRIVYVAAGIRLPGSYGGATHTWEVARGLQALGHEIHVLAHQPQRQWQTLFRPLTRQVEGITIHYLDYPKALAFLAYPQLRRLLRRLQPDALIERYYNLAGAGVLAAAQSTIPVLLEVNALIIDPPAVAKRRWDDRFGRPLQRWAIRQCQLAARIVTPLATTVPAQIARSKIAVLPWGANVEAFQPIQDGERLKHLRTQLGIPPERPVVVFLGSFRAWHGVRDFVAAAVRVLQQGAAIHWLLIGDGPEHAAAEQDAQPWADSFSFVGSLPHDQVPLYLALAAVGVAPFNTAPHPALRAAGFFWSPLKIYEYMAMGLPVVTARIPPLDAVIRDGIEGALFTEGDPDDLAATILRVLNDPNRAAMGQRARARVVAEFSWQVHCQALDRMLQRMIARPA